MIQKLKAHPDVNEQVLIPELDIPRHTTRSVNTSAILDDPVVDDITSVLQPAQKFIDKCIQKIKDFGKWLLDYIPPKQKVVDEAQESFKNLIKNCTRRETLYSNWKSQKLRRKVSNTVSIDGKDWFYHDLFLVNAKQSITNHLIDRRQTKVKLILSCMMETVDLKGGEVIAKESAFHSKTDVNLEVLTLAHCCRKWKKLFWSP